MSVTYTWELSSLKVKTAQEVENVVVQTYWKKIGTLDANTEIQGTFSGATPFTNFDPENYTPFADLTETQVLGWIQANVTGSYEEHVNAQIQKQIDEKLNPESEISGNTFPWSA